MMAPLWMLLAGALLILMALVGSAMDRLPLSPALIYLLIGMMLGPSVFNVVSFDPRAHIEVFNILCEVVVVISLFTVGLKLRTSARDPHWWLPLRLATLSMLVCIAAVTAVGVWMLHLPLGAAVLLGAILAPTDPVLASDIQVRHADDRDRARFALTGEGGLNDGAAFPFVLLGLGLLGVRELGPFGARWLAFDLLWPVAAGLAIGWLCGRATGLLTLYVRHQVTRAAGWEEFLTLGLIASSYGLTLLVHANGFLAVLAAGLALRRIETDAAPGAEKARAEIAPEEHAIAPQTAPAHMVGTLLGNNERLERLGELVVVLALGVSLSTVHTNVTGWWLAALLFLVIRPVSVLIGLAGSACSMRERRLMAWFGIRGIGSLFYMSYAMQAGLSPQSSEALMPTVLTLVAASIAVHGVSAAPLMLRFERKP